MKSRSKQKSEISKIVPHQRALNQGYALALKRAVEGKHLADAGIALALDHAGEEWKVTALNLVREWCASHRPKLTGGVFAFEDIRAWISDPVRHRLPPPPSANAWGGLARAAASAGIIKFTGRYRAATSPQTHGHPVKLYRVGKR